MRYGRHHEIDALNYLKQNLMVDAKPYGLFVDPKLPYLGATPDGLIADDGLIEVKCPLSCQKLTPEEAITSRKFTIWTFDKKNNEIGVINRKHKYYFQVQGQLHITNRNYCLFMLWTEKGAKIEKILKDDLFWSSSMEPKLKAFYFDCLLPELIDPRFPLSMPIRDPDYIVVAKEKKRTHLLATSLST